MNSKKLFLYTLSTIVLISCTKVVEGQSPAEIIESLDIVTLIASAPFLLEAISDSTIIIADKIGPVLTAVATFNFEEAIAIFGEVVVNISAVVAAAVANIVLASGVLIPILNSSLGPFLEELDPLSITDIFNTSVKELAIIDDGSCESEYTYSIENVTLKGISDMEITSFVAVDPEYEDNEFSGSFDVEFGGNATLKTIIEGNVYEQNCTGHNSTENFQAIDSAGLEQWALKFTLKATVVDTNMTVNGLSFVSSNFVYGTENRDLTYEGEGAVYTSLQEKVWSEIDDYKADLDSDEFFNYFIDSFEFPVSVDLPFPFPF